MRSFPYTIYQDWLIIIGHNFDVKRYLTMHDIYEKNIVAITCDGCCNFKKIHFKDKMLYIPHQNKKNLVDILSGREFGIAFDLTESEIMFYNSPQTWPLKERIKNSFIPLSKYRRHNS